jgi:hypothetical protein
MVNNNDNTALMEKTPEELRAMYRDFEEKVDRVYRYAEYRRKATRKAALGTSRSLRFFSWVTSCLGLDKRSNE